MPTTIRPADIDRYTNGDCHIFAYQLSKATGWKIHAFIYENDFPDLHAFCINEKDNPVDIEGEHSIIKFRKTWNTKAKIAEVKWEDLREWGSISYSHRRAKKLIPILLKSLDYEPQAVNI